MRALQNTMEIWLKILITPNGGKQNGCGDWGEWCCSAATRYTCCLLVLLFCHVHFFIFNKCILTLMKLTHWVLSRRQKESDYSSLNRLGCGTRQWLGCTTGQQRTGGNSQELGRTIRHEERASDQKNERRVTFQNKTGSHEKKNSPQWDRRDVMRRGFGKKSQILVCVLTASDLSRRKTNWHLSRKKCLWTFKGLLNKPDMLPVLNFHQDASFTSITVMQSACIEPLFMIWQTL